MGLVGWNYCYIVYCLASGCNTRVKDNCFRKKQGGGGHRYPISICYIPLQQVNGLCALRGYTVIIFKCKCYVNELIVAGVVLFISFILVL